MGVMVRLKEGACSLNLMLLFFFVSAWMALTLQCMIFSHATPSVPVSVCGILYFTFLSVALRDGRSLYCKVKRRAGLVTSLLVLVAGLAKYTIRVDYLL